MKNFNFKQALHKSGAIDWFNSTNVDYLNFQNILSNFAELIAEHEREACAEVCERLNMRVVGNDELTGERCVAAKECSDAIRKRGQA